METFTTEAPVTVGDVTLIPVVRICLHSNAPDKSKSKARDNFTDAYWLSGNKEPLAIIVCDTNGVRAFDMSSTEITITSLLQKIPDLNTMLVPYR